MSRARTRSAVLAMALATIACLPRHHLDERTDPALSHVACVAVLPFDDAAVGDGAGEAFSRQLASHLAKDVSVLDPSEGGRLLALRGINLPPSTDDLEARELGSILGVQAVVLGEVRRDDLVPPQRAGLPARANVEAEARLIDVKSGKKLWAGSFGGNPLEFFDDAHPFRDDASAAAATLMAARLQDGLTGSHAGGPCWKTKLDPPPPTPVPTPTILVAIVSTPTPTPTPELKFIVVDPVKKQIELKQMVHFKLNTATFEGNPGAILDEIVTVLKENPKMEIRIEGYTDSTGKPVHNLQLSQARANTIRDYIVVNGGIDTNRLRAIGLGIQSPVASNKSSAGRALNRRVEFHITKQ
jgi:outer membrane protein OmpA-like peptidoglycan-associated protein